MSLYANVPANNINYLFLLSELHHTHNKCLNVFYLQSIDLVEQVLSANVIR